MEICSRCEKELSGKSGCPECGQGAAGSKFLNLPKKFWMTVIGVVPLAVMSFFDWAKISSFEMIGQGGDGVKFFSVLSRNSNINKLLEIFDAGSQEFIIFKAAEIIMVVLFLLSFVLIIISLVKFKSKIRVNLAYLGFGLNALVSAGFIAMMALVNIKIERLTGNLAQPFINLTVIPYLMLAAAVAALTFLVRRPMLLDNSGQQGSSKFKWAFYIAYPLHIAILAVLRYLLK